MNQIFKFEKIDIQFKSRTRSNGNKWKLSLAFCAKIGEFTSSKLVTLCNIIKSKSERFSVCACAKVGGRGERLVIIFTTTP